MDYFQHRLILHIIKQSRNPRETERQREREKDNLTILIPFKIDFSMPGELCIQLQILPIKKKKKNTSNSLPHQASAIKSCIFFKNH